MTRCYCQLGWNQGILSLESKTALWRRGIFLQSGRVTLLIKTGLTPIGVRSSLFRPLAGMVTCFFTRRKLKNGDKPFNFTSFVEQKFCFRVEYDASISYNKYGISPYIKTRQHCYTQSDAPRPFAQRRCKMTMIDAILAYPPFKAQPYIFGGAS